jgi:hypothetical protein
MDLDLLALNFILPWQAPPTFSLVLIGAQATQPLEVLLALASSLLVLPVFALAVSLP